MASADPNEPGSVAAATEHGIGPLLQSTAVATEHGVSSADSDDYKARLRELDARIIAELQAQEEEFRARRTTSAEMTGSATEQPDIGMDPSFAVPAHPAGPTGSTGPVNAMNLGTLPLVTQMKWEIHVEFNNDMWWAMPHELSDSILGQWTPAARQVSFIWDWQATRKGSYKPNGTDTSISRYIIDFDTMHQRNIDNDRTRKVKVVCVLPSPA